MNDYDIQKAFKKQPKANEWLAGLPGEKRDRYKMPDENCKKCYGRGHVGFSEQAGGWVICDCMRAKKHGA